MLETVTQYLLVLGRATLPGAGLYLFISHLAACYFTFLIQNYSSVTWWNNFSFYLYNTYS